MRMIGPPASATTANPSSDGMVASVVAPLSIVSSARVRPCAQNSAIIGETTPFITNSGNDIMITRRLAAP